MTECFDEIFHLNESIAIFLLSFRMVEIKYTLDKKRHFLNVVRMLNKMKLKRSYLNEAYRYYRDKKFDRDINSRSII